MVMGTHNGITYEQADRIIELLEQLVNVCSETYSQILDWQAQDNFALKMKIGPVYQHVSKCL